MEKKRIQFSAEKASVRTYAIFVVAEKQKTIGKIDKKAKNMWHTAWEGIAFLWKCICLDSKTSRSRTKNSTGRAMPLATTI